MSRRTLAFTLAFLGLNGLLSASASADASRHAALILDGNTGAVLHEEEADEPRHPASLTKMMTLYLTFETLDSGRLKMSDEITISDNAAGVAPSKLDLKPGEGISVADAIKAVVTKSANDIAVALAEKIGGSEANFVRLMNARASEIGMSRTHFENASGLPDDDQVTTARDMATLALHLEDDYPTYFPLFATRTFTYQHKTYGNHNTMLNSFAGVDGIKTGYTRASGFNLVTSVHRGERHLIGVVFGGASAATRNGEMRVLLTRGLIRASSKKTRKPAPLLLAKLDSAPKVSERPALKRRPKPEIAAASADDLEATPKPFAPAKSAPQVVAEAAPEPAFRDIRNSEPPAAAEVPETPIQIFKVRQVSVLGKPRPVTPDNTTDMEDTGGATEAPATPSRGTTSRTDLGHFAEKESADPPAAKDEIAALVNQTAPDSDRSTRVAETASAPRARRADQVEMLGAADTPPARDETLPPPVGATPVTFEPIELGPAQPEPGPEPAPKVLAKRPTPPPNVDPPVARGLPPSTLDAQASTLGSSTAPRKATFRPTQFAAVSATAGRYEVQIGAYGSIDEAQRALTNVQGRAGQLLSGIASVTHPAMKDGHQVFRARFTGFNADRAASTCNALRRQSVDCFVMAAQ